MLSVSDVRAYIKDLSQNNKIFLSTEFTDSNIQTAIDWAFKDLETIPPFIEGIGNSSYPDALMLDGALGRLFDSAAALELRNQANLAEQNIPVPVGQNGNIYQQLADRYTAKFEAKVNRFKMKLNLEASLDYQGSPYRYGDGSDYY